MKNVLFVIALVLTTPAQAQSLAELKTRKDQHAYDNSYTNWMLRYTHLSGKNAEPLGGFTVNVSIGDVESEKGEVSFYYENVWLGDLLWQLFHLKDFKSTVSRANRQVFTSGLLGWFHGYYNVVATDKLIIAPGISVGDYIFGDNTSYTIEPNGYYLHIGPGVKTSYLINDTMWLDAFLNLDYGAAVKHRDDPARYQREVGYPRPIFANLNVNFCTTYKVFAGLRVNQLIDRGDNHHSATRVDFSIGYRALRYK
jgi:hypothetical protein